MSLHGYSLPQGRYLWELVGIMAILYDQHLHSWHSWDCRTDPEDNVKHALARGLAGLTFTEHFDTHPDEWEQCGYDDEAYSATIDRLRERYGDRIFIGKGIEVCYQPSRMGFILDFLASHTFDLVLLSVHYSGDKPVHTREYWQASSVEDGSRRYFEYVLQAVEHCRALHAERGRIFDVLAHLDFLKRYTKRFFDVEDLSFCDDLVEKILATCIEADLTPEINTSTLRQGFTETMPGERVVLRYGVLGGKAMSVGSDGHTAEGIGTGFDRAQEMLHAAGIQHLAVFKGRKREEILLG